MIYPGHPVRIARCECQSQRQDPDTGFVVERTLCGVFPALLTADGLHICPWHFTEFYECVFCHWVGQTLHETVFVSNLDDTDDEAPAFDGGLCPACKANWDNPATRAAMLASWAQRLR